MSQDTSRRWLPGIAAVVLAAMLWGTTGTTQALLPEGREPLVVAAARLLVGALALIALALVTKGGRVDHVLRLPARLVIAAGLMMSAYNIAFFSAVNLTGVAVGTAVTIGSGPLWVSLIETVMHRRLPSPRQLIGQALAITGATVLVTSGGLGTMSAGGIVVAALAGLCYASYAVVTSRMPRELPSTVVAAASFSIAALATLPILFALPINWALAPAPLMLLASLGVFATGLAYALYTWGLREVPLGTAVTLTLVEPLTAFLLAIVVVGEVANALGLVGMGVLLVGLWIVIRQA